MSQSPLEPAPDHLERFLSAHPPQVPADLTDRVLEAIQDPQAVKTLFWRDVERLCRPALVASAAGLLLSVGLFSSVVGGSASESGSESVQATAAELEDLRRLIQPQFQVERQIAGGHWLLSGEE